MKHSKALMTMGALLLATACGGAGKTTTEPKVDVENKSADKAEAPAITEEEKFRLSYTNPGGMWMPSQITLEEHRENFKKMGVSIPAEQLADPLGSPLAAVVSLGGCSASFVSKDGLIATNHHCVQGGLRHNSNEKQNLVENGFLAKTKADELSAGPANRVWVARAFKNVTAEMRDGLEKIKDPIKRKKESEKRQKKLVADCEKDRPGIRCSVRSFFNNAEYQLIENLEIRDVRLVYVPQRSVGDYGGEIDNWAWPRHTGDFSFLRAYVGKDGMPADYSKDNVPYQPSHYLKVSKNGVKPGDFVMVVGYPGRTSRMQTAAGLKHDVEWYYPHTIEFLRKNYETAEKLLSSPDKNTAIKAGVSKQFIQNALEKYESMLSGLSQGDRMKQKAELDAKIKAWVAEPGREALKADIEKMEALEAKQRETAATDYAQRNVFRQSRLLSEAFDLVRMAEERPKKDEDRKPGFQERDKNRQIASEKAFAGSYDRTLDRALFKNALMWAAALPKSERPWLRMILTISKNREIDEAAIDEALEKMYAATKLEDEALRIDLLEKGTKAKLKAQKDPFIDAALAVWSIYKAEEDKSDKLEGEYLLVAPAYAKAMREVMGGALSPDANSTLRITYGTVKSFNPDSQKEADWPFTVARQILSKDTGREPFNSPKALLDAIRERKFGSYAQDFVGGDLPLDFLSDLDITGGNSGSATLNDKGELVGLAFDGTIEGVASDAVFDGKTTRTIQVTSTYFLWVMDAIDNADHLLKEMGIEPSL